MRFKSAESMGAFADSVTTETFKPQSEALEKRKKTLGNVHPEIIDLIINLYAKHWLVDLDISKTEGLVRDALDAARITYGDNDQRTLAMMCDLGIVLREQDRHDESRELLQTVLDERSQLWGDTDRRTLRVLEELIQAHHFAGDHAAAKSVFDIWLSHSDATFGDEEVVTLNKLLIIADVLIEREQYEQAERYCRLAYGRISIFQPEYPRNWTSSGMFVHQQMDYLLGDHIPMKLALVLEKQEKYASLEPILNDMVTAHSAYWIPPRPSTEAGKKALSQIRRLAEILDAQGKHDESDEQRLRANRLAQDIADEERTARLREEDLTHRRDNGLFPYAHRHEGKWYEAYIESALQLEDEMEQGRRMEAIWHEAGFTEDGDLAFYDEEYERAEELYLDALGTSEMYLGPKHSHHLENVARIVRMYEAWHEAAPDAGHDAKAAEYRALLQITDTTKN